MKFFISLKNLLSYFNRKPFHYVVLGDSTAEGIGASSHENAFTARVFNEIKKQRNEAVYYNFGRSGAVIKDVLRLQAKKAVELNPDLIIISVGFNDIKRGRRLLTLEKDFTQLLEILSLSTAKIYVCGIPDVGKARKIPKFLKPYVSYRTEQFNEVIKRLSSTHNATFIDLYKATKNIAVPDDFISSDGLHPSDAGYAFLALEVMSHILV